MSEHAKILLKIDKINQDKSIQTRQATDLAVVSEYAEAMRKGEEFPPCIVFRQGNEYFLADGWHRLKAAQLAGKDQILVIIRPGTERDALFYAVGANASHGKQRTRADKERAILILLQDPEWSQLSDLELCRVAKINTPAIVPQVREKYGIDKRTVRIMKRGSKLTAIDITNFGRESDYAAEIKNMPYNPKTSKELTGAIKIIDACLLKGGKAYINKGEAMTMRKKICKAITEIENHEIAGKIKRKKAA